MNIYFSGSIRGGRDHNTWYEYIVLELKKYGNVLTEFVADKNLSSYGTLNLTNEEIYKRDVDLIKQSDIVIADVTIPSLGVGYEIAFAESINKKIYCIYNKEDDKRISAMIAGCPNFESYPYNSKEELIIIINKIFN